MGSYPIEIAFQNLSSLEVSKIFMLPQQKSQ